MCTRGAYPALLGGRSTSPLNGRLLRGTTRHAREGDTPRLRLPFRILRRIHRGSSASDLEWSPHSRRLSGWRCALRGCSAEVRWSVLAENLAYQHLGAVAVLAGVVVAVVGVIGYMRHAI